MSVYNPASINQPSEKKPISRREFLYIMLGMSVSASAAAVCAWSAIALMPQSLIGGPNTIIEVPQTTIDYVRRNPRTPTLVDGSFFLTYSNEGLIALSRICTYQPFRIVWEKINNRFVCPLYGVKYTALGKKISLRAPRGLDMNTIIASTATGTFETNRQGDFLNIDSAISTKVDFRRVIPGTV